MEAERYLWWFKVLKGCERVNAFQFLVHAGLVLAFLADSRGGPWLTLIAVNLAIQVAIPTAILAGAFSEHFYREHWR